MTSLALVGLLAGSLALSPTGPGDDKKTTDADKPAATEALPGVFETAPAELPIIQDSYAFGRSTTASPIKFWVSYAYGTADEQWDLGGSEQDLTIATTPGEIATQRANVGAEISFLNFTRFSVGAGANLTVAKNEFNASGTSPNFTNGIGDVESTFGLQGVKVYGAARGRVLGVHGGYIFDLGEDREFTTQAQADVPGFGNLPLSINAAGVIRPTPLVAGVPGFQPLLLPSTLSTSDGRDAIFFGADFDYPSERFRLFGGVDYFLLQGRADEPGTVVDEGAFSGDDFLNIMAGGGVRLGFAEIGAALQIQTRMGGAPAVGVSDFVGGHAGTIAPYLKISPPNLPVSIFAKGAVQEEYTEYGYAIGGANSIRPGLGATVGLTLGFE